MFLLFNISDKKMAKILNIYFKFNYSSNQKKIKKLNIQKYIYMC